MSARDNGACISEKKAGAVSGIGFNGEYFLLSVFDDVGFGFGAVFV
nr:hypothetical protein [Planococcus glaciei]